MDKVWKIFPSTIKEVSDKPRTLEFAITTEAKDRMGDVVKADGGQYDNYVKNPVVLFGHDYSSLPVGKATQIRREGQATVARVEFPTKEEYEFADTVYKLAKGGYLNATSIGFIPVEFDYVDEDGKPTKNAGWDTPRVFTKWELLEFSIVPVPANPEALISARNAGLITVKEFQAVRKSKEDWDKAAKVEDAKGPAPASQPEIRDELDYALSLCKVNTLNEDNKVLAKSLISELTRLTGSDIPEKITATVKEFTESEVLAIVTQAINEWRQSHND